ncbi:uncharacterized protein LOC134279798 [Saccostrea cucullata]|uniref:uncharacterized protein LOC134279798 n=1 Tax=Saccostrea cuccullata TaxID=36930 RepID=UPI002ED3E0E4
MRRSLRGSASRVLMRLGPNASVDEILYKLDSIYGLVEEKESLLANFYSAKQQENEDVSAWGCRLEDLLSKALIQGLVNPDDENDMLRNMFWSGMRTSLKDISGHLYDKYPEFDDLRRAMRILEQDREKRKSESDKQNKPIPAKRTNVEKKSNETEELITTVNRLSTELEALKRERANDQHQSRSIVRGNYTPRYRGPHRFRRPMYNRFQYQQTPLTPEFVNQNTAYRPQGETPVCWKCGQQGHLQIGCRVRGDYMKRGYLNAYRPSPRGKR